MLGQNIGRVGLPDMSAGGRPSLTLDFVSIPVLNEKITFSRASGATWFSPDGVLQGVDFSTTSVAIGTGSKSFTLTATAGVNRYWAVNDLVRVSQQSNSANFMEGTVTSYTASTQVLVIDVTSTGGSGTIASWRVASHMPRFDYDPSTLAARGLLIEEQRTNSIRNNTMQGAVAGTPGTLPTNWAASTVLTGLTRTIATGTENGISYIDVRLNGTPSASGRYDIFYETSTQVAALNGQTWTNSGYFKLQAGTLSGVTAVRLYFEEKNSGGAYLTEQNTTITNPTSAALSTQRASATRTLNQATTAFLLSGFNLLLDGTAIDITLRIGLPQLELGAFATSVIPTVNAFALGVTRNPDQASVNTLSPWYNSVSGTLFAEAQVAAGIGAAPAVMAGLDDTTINNRLQLRRQSPGTIGDGRFVSSGGNWTGTATSGTLTGVNKQATAYASSDQAGAVNGTLMTGIVSVATLPTITRLALGDGQGSTPLNGWLRRVSYFPRRLANAELQSLTS